MIFILRVLMAITIAIAYIYCFQIWRLALFHKTFDYFKEDPLWKMYWELFALPNPARKNPMVGVLWVVEVCLGTMLSRYKKWQRANPDGLPHWQDKSK